MSPKVIVETKRLVLRELVPADAPRLFEIYCDSETMQFMGPPPESVEAEAKNIAAYVENSYRRRGFGLWGVVERGTGDLIGRCGLLAFELREETQVEISYLLGRRYWRKGYATEAAAAVVDFAFDGLGIERLFALIAPANEPSLAVARRLVFRREGLTEYKQFGTVELYSKRRGEPASGV